MSESMIYKALKGALAELEAEDLEVRVQEGTLASDLHTFYNNVGLSEGWLKPEYATPLSEQDAVNQVKNIDAAKDVIKYWVGAIETGELSGDAVLEAMSTAVAYEDNRGYSHLEAAADSQHEAWKSFVGANQAERVTPGHEKFRQDNYDQFTKGYGDLSPKEMDQDRLVVAVITDRVLEKAEISYVRQIE